MRIRLESIGCRLNISEVETLARRFAAMGHRIVGQGDAADLCVFNSCTVTNIASKKSRHLIRQMRRSHPSATIVVTGCHAELEPDEVRALGVDVIVGNRLKEEMPDLLERQGLLVEPESENLEAQEQLWATGPESRTRAFLKVQDGCDQRCAFCVVTLARGEGRSAAADDLVRDVQRLEATGFKEVVLTGVHLGSYGSDLGEVDALRRLIKRLLSETGIMRFRLSSLEPWDLVDGFFDIFGDRRVLPHLHLPLQSGCDATLRRMARRTSRKEFRTLVDAARAVVPRLAVTSDVIVGFPGETEAEFAESIAFIEEMAFSGLHIFRYSRRKGTRAAELAGQIPGNIAQERSKEMHALAARLEQAFQMLQIGTVSDVLWETAEEKEAGQRWSGLSDNYIRVITETATGIDLSNTIRPTRLISQGPGVMIGRVEELVSIEPSF